MSADASLRHSAQAGIHRLSLPTPFPVGPVNCYLIEDRPLTLLDTGPNSGTTLDELERALATHRHRIEDLELIVVTHQHMDHLGLLEIIQRRSRAEVAALDLLGPYLAQFADSAAADDRFAQSLMRDHGVPQDLVSSLGATRAIFRSFGSRADVTRRLRDGDTLALGDRRLEVFHRPGHSPSDTVFWDPDRRILIAGDHLIGHISSNALIARPLSEDGSRARRPSALISYIASMRATRELPAEVVLPGHGEPIAEHRALIDERLRMHERRADKILSLLAGRPLTAYDIAVAIWGRVAITQTYLALSETLGHLDLLLADGRAHELGSNGVSRFAVS